MVFISNKYVDKEKVQQLQDELTLVKETANELEKINKLVEKEAKITKDRI